MIEKIQEIQEKYFKWVVSISIAGTILVIALVVIFPPLKNVLIDSGAINLLVLIFLLDSVNYLIKINKNLEDKNKIIFYSNQSDAKSDVTNYIKEHKPQKADLIEYSSEKAQDILDQLKVTNCKEIRLLIAHPDIAVSTKQADRIWRRMENIYDIDFMNFNNNLKVRCYNTYKPESEEYEFFPSIRGRQFDDNFLCFSWYTPTIKIRGGLLGHENPMICVYTDTSEGKILKKHFDDTFELLWSTSRPMDEVYKEIKNRSSNNVKPTHLNEYIPGQSEKNKEAFKAAPGQTDSTIPDQMMGMEERIRDGNHS